MASSSSAAKPSKSKTPASSGDGIFSGDHEIAHHLTGNAEGSDLSDKLKVFKTSQFDPDAYVTSKCQTMSEKEIRHLCSHLRDLQKASAEEMRKSVLANYSAFIRTSKEISDLEGELISIRNLLSARAALVHVLAEGGRVDSLSTAREGLSEEDISSFERKEPSKIEKWSEEFPDNLDILLAERRVDEALAAIEEGEVVAKEAEEKQTLSPDALLLLQNSISEQRQKLAEQLAETACQPSTHRVELRSAISALKHLGDGPRAHTLLLNAHFKRLQHNVQALRPLRNSSGGVYTASLSQLVFSAIDEAADDSFYVFDKEPAYASELVTWAVRRTEDFAHLVKRHVLSSLVASGGFRAAADCVKKALGHCSLLEARGLALCPVLLKLFRPCVEQALRAYLKRIEENTATLAAADKWELSYPPVGMHPSGKVIAAQPKLSNSAHKFNSMVQEFFVDVNPLLSMQLGSATMEGLLQVFTFYVSLLMNALPGSIEDEGNLEGCGNRIVCMAETEEQQLALLANASLLADELLPLAAMQLASVNHGGRNDEPLRRTDRQNRVPEQREWKKRVQRSVDRLRDSFCRQHTLDLIFTEDGDTRLSADTYISMDGHTSEPEWFPSPIFQELFMKLNRIACIAIDMFVRRERFASLLLMRLVETFIMWLSNDQTFWADIEDSRGLGPLGLRQFYLDMQFVILFTSQGRYLSKNLHLVIKNIMARAIEAFEATGQDPSSALPEDDWFAEVSQVTIEMLSGNANHDMPSPTASISAQSMSSYVSHGPEL
ncbi:hypothetical protein Scep_017623 [Stephania cephalantha]|uniref:Exocyst component Exo84 C-terminal domain-containing protein n=1 Tax=Stephania cephalantha TaxID=152367 RepID=A0AAP0NVU2_9MAGN